MYFRNFFLAIKTGKGQGFKPSVAHLYLKIGRVPPPPDKNWPKLLTFMLLAVFSEIMPVIMQFAIWHGRLIFDFE